MPYPHKRDRAPENQTHPGQAFAAARKARKIHHEPTAEQIAEGLAYREGRMRVDLSKINGYGSTSRYSPW
jgi:hypothetical protein